MKKRVAVIGYGNIGKAVIEAISASGDFELAGVVRRDAANKPDELSKIKVAGSVNELGKVDVAVICAPSRSVPVIAKELLEAGISCVDSFDIHSEIYPLKQELDVYAKKSGAVSVIAAGWDPGSDSVIRALMLAMSPKGITYTNFGPGMSMGHTVCARSKKGVKDALSMTMPAGGGIHSRIVYVELEKGASLEDVAAQIKSDKYFANDQTHVIPVDCVNSLKDTGHGVSILRKGVSGQTHNQLFNYEMRINNPALTGQFLLSCARAALKQPHGCYTVIELPPVNLLEGGLKELTEHLV